MTGQRTLLGRASGPALLVAAGAALLAWTWRAWPDPLVDFGRELYVPWRLNAGEVLFRDLAWFNGPLSPYVNALWFQLFGTGFMTLALANLAILACALALAYGLLARSAGRWAATVGGLLFLSMFAFAQLVGIANYNWLAPYSHEATHGLTLALATLAALAAWRRGGRRAWLAAGGLALGASFLTKPETFLAAAAAAGVLLLSPGVARRRGDWLAFAAAALAPPLLAAGLLSLAMPAEAALRGTLGAWPSVLDGRISALPFYRAGLGLDDPPRRALELLRWSGGWLLVLAPAAGLAWVARGGAYARRAWGAGLALATVCSLWLARDQVAWLQAGRPLPLVALAAGAALARGLARGADRERAVPALALAALALALLLKMILQARVINYGFTLALPATLLAAAALTGWIPAWLDRRGAAGSVFRAGATAMLACAAAAHLAETGRWLERKTEVVGSGRDAFRADVRGRFVNEAVRSVVEGQVATMAVLPEGVMLNYLARIPNPTPYVNFMPPELILFGEPSWLAAFRAAPPDVVLFAHKDTSEYGFPLFGRDYGAALADWVRAEYRPIGLLGQEPLQPGTSFGLRLFARGKQP